MRMMWLNLRVWWTHPETQAWLRGLRLGLMVGAVLLVLLPLALRAAG